MHEPNKSYCIVTWRHRVTFIQFDDDDDDDGGDDATVQVNYTMYSHVFITHFHFNFESFA